MNEEWSSWPGAPAGARAAHRWRLISGRLTQPWPLTVRVPVAAGLLIFLVSVAISQLMLTSIYREQEEGLVRLADVYLDGLAAAVYQPVADRDSERAERSLQRVMRFHQGIRELRILVRLGEGTIFADVRHPELDPGRDLGALPEAVVAALDAGEDGGFVVSDATGTGWVYRPLTGEAVAPAVIAQLDLRRLEEKRAALWVTLLSATLLLSAAAALAGYLMVAVMLGPVRTLIDRLEAAQRGRLAAVQERDLPPATTEFGRLLRAFNGMVEAIEERRHLAARLAERDKAAVLGRLAGTVAHEVRNPLGGMLNALDTVRKFGGRRETRERGLELIERGLLSIGDVVGRVLAVHRMPTNGRPLTPEDMDDLRLLIEGEARRRGVVLHWISALDSPLDVGSTEIRQIVLNLLLNACSSTPGGGTVRFGAVVEADGELRLEIADEGPGMPEDAARRLRGIEDSSRLAASGMGLSIVRELVVALNGTVEITGSGQGPGTCIVVRVPAREAADGQA